MKKSFFILLISTFSCFSFAQKKTIIDSLKIEYYKSKEDTTKVLLLNLISRRFYSINSDSTEFYARKALKKSKEINYHFGNAKSYRMIGLSYLGSSNYDDALKYMYLSLKELRRTNRIHEFGTVFTSIGIIYRQKSNYQTALKYYLKAIEIVEKTNDSIRMSPAYNNIGVVYKNMNNYEKALEYYQKSLEIKKRTKDKVNLPYTLGNIAIIYIEKKQYTIAIEKLTEVLNMFSELGFKNEIANSYLLIGKAYYYKKNYNLALENINKSINIYKETGELSGKAEALLIKGNIYYSQNNYYKAKLLLSEAFQISKEIESNELVMNSYLYLSNLDSISGNYKGALKYYQKYIDLKDEIFNIEKNNAFIEIQSKYDISVKEQENALLKKNKEISDIKLHKQTNLNYFTWALSGLLVFIVLFIVLYLYKVRKTNRLLNQKNDEILAQNITLEEHKEKITSQYKEISLKNEELTDYKKHLEKLVEQRTVKLYDALKTAKKSDNLKTEFLLNLSHEIRTPINAISGFSEIILNDKKDFKIEYIDAVKKSMGDLVNTIERLVVFSKFQVGEYKLNTEKKVLLRFFDEIKETTTKRKKTLKKENIKLKYEIDSSITKRTFKTDFYVLSNSLTELIENAFKFTNKGLITIKANISNENKLCISVKDTGMGIKKDVIKYVFDFLRKFDNDNEIFRGMGVGLALVKKGIELISGEINIKSILNEGAEFTITIPELT